MPLQEWAAGARKREAEDAERKRVRELEKQATREARKQVPRAPDCTCLPQRWHEVASMLV